MSLKEKFSKLKDASKPQVNFGNEYELICPCPCNGCEHSDMFFYLWADRSLANLSIIRRSLFHARTLVGEN